MFLACLALLLCCVAARASGDALPLPAGRAPDAALQALPSLALAYGAEPVRCGDRVRATVRFEGGAQWFPAGAHVELVLVSASFHEVRSIKINRFFSWLTQKSAAGVRVLRQAWFGTLFDEDGGDYHVGIELAEVARVAVPAERTTELPIDVELVSCCFCCELRNYCFSLICIECFLTLKFSRR